MTKTYLITDANGSELTSGVQESEVARIAQTKADARGEAVTVTPYHLEDGERIDHDAEAYDVQPSDDEP